MKNIALFDNFNTHNDNIINYTECESYHKILNTFNTKNVTTADEESKNILVITHTFLIMSYTAQPIKCVIYPDGKITKKHLNNEYTINTVDEITDINKAEEALKYLLSVFISDFSRIYNTFIDNILKNDNVSEKCKITKKDIDSIDADAVINKFNYFLNYILQNHIYSGISFAERFIMSLNKNAIKLNDFDNTFIKYDKFIKLIYSAFKTAAPVDKLVADYIIYSNKQPLEKMRQFTYHLLSKDMAKYIGQVIKAYMSVYDNYNLNKLTDLNFISVPDDVINIVNNKKYLASINVLDLTSLLDHDTVYKILQSKNMCDVINTFISYPFDLKFKNDDEFTKKYLTITIFNRTIQSYNNVVIPLINKYNCKNITQNKNIIFDKTIRTIILYANRIAIDLFSNHLSEIKNSKNIENAIIEILNSNLTELVNQRNLSLLTKYIFDIVNTPFLHDKLKNNLSVKFMFDIHDSIDRLKFFNVLNFIKATNIIIKNLDDNKYKQLIKTNTYCEFVKLLTTFILTGKELETFIKHNLIFKFKKNAHNSASFVSECFHADFNTLLLVL